MSSKGLRFAQMKLASPTSWTSLLALFLLALGCRGPGEEHPRVPEGTPIVLVSVDTLRSDRLPAYGYSGVETPALDRLRGDSILFERAWAPAPLTLPSHVSALTGLLPPGHGVRDNMGYRFDAAAMPYLPRWLKEAGYRTGAAVSAFVLRATSGLDAGFDFYDDRITFRSWTDLGSVQRPGGETLARAVEWMRGVAGEPFFLFFHIYEPHTPHEPPEPFRSRYDSPYDGEVAAADAIVGELLAELEALGVYDRAVVILTSDHGEGLNDHGDYEHGPLLYREIIQVPLLLKLPGGERGGTTVERAAELVDLFPTVAALLGKAPPEGLDGMSLLAPVGAARPVYSETFFGRLHFGWSELASLVDYPWHLIDGPDPELYDLAADPGERVNLLERERRTAARLKKALDGYDRAFRPAAEVDPETRRRLAALGYVGGGTSASGSAEGPLPDPKARLGSLAVMRRAFEHALAGEHRQAAAAFREVIAAEPGMVDAWEQLGQALLQTGDVAGAIEAYERAVELSGGAPHVALSAAAAYLRVGRLEEAQTHAELALETHELARDLLAQIALRRGRVEEAARRAEEAVAGRGARLGPLLTLAEVRLRQGRFGEAIELGREAEREFGERADREALRGLYFTRGRAFVGLGKAEEAERAFQAEIALSPSELAPYTHLAFLYALEGDGRRAGATLKGMVEANPSPAAYAEAVRTLEAMGDPRSAAAVLAEAKRRWPGSPALSDLGR